VVAAPGFSTRINDVGIEAIPAYNIKSERLQFHPKANGWVGYIVEAQGKRIYHAGDTDFIPGMKSLGSIYAAMLPVGGKYTMDVDEAMEAAKAIKPEFFVPMHYKNLLGIEGSQKVEEELRKIGNCRIMREVQEPTYSF
jgi:L-ascorbate metabolism protein UlaG (beta-lactamase superfamily)